MAELTLIIGNKNYSSWSMRAGVALGHFDIDFEEVVIPLDRPDSKARIHAYSSAGRVPILRDGDLTIWESLAICEYVAETHTSLPMWPVEPNARAHARAVAHEMHAGFEPLRRELPMDCRAQVSDSHGSEATQSDIDRIVGLWNDCRSLFGAPGDDGFLFGSFSIADAMFAPVAARFATYDVPLPPIAADYRDAVIASPAVDAWIKAATVEPWIIETPKI